MNKIKTKDLTIDEYFEILEKEYYVCEIRKKIYPSKKDKLHYEKVMGFKKIKIEDIAKKNLFVTIFDDEREKDRIRSQVYPIEGLPQFSLTEQDVLNYYLPDSSVRIKIDGEMKVGKIVKNDLKANVIFVKLRGESRERPFMFFQVTRVL